MTQTDNNFKLTQSMQIQKQAGQDQFGASRNATLFPGQSHTRYYKSALPHSWLHSNRDGLDQIIC
jgi:hypothetical protein